MSAWKRIAFEKLPEYRQTIGKAENPMALWIELHLIFEGLYRTKNPDDGLIRRFYEYARWCVASPGEGQCLSNAGTAAVCAFYEHLPQTDTVRRDLPRWLSREEFASLRDAFRYHLSDEQFANFEAGFLETKSKSSHLQAGDK